MAYVTTAELAARLGTPLYARLTDRAAGTTADAAVAQQIVDEAEAVANSYLAVRYATPIDLVRHPELAEVLRARVLDLAEYAAWQSSPFVNDLPGRVQRLDELARRWLIDVAAGEAQLPAAHRPAARTMVDETPLWQAAPRVFTQDELDGL